MAAPVRAPRRILAIRLAASCGSTNAGGEDFGYFAPGKAGSNPAFGVTYRGSGLARAVASRAPIPPRGGLCVGVTESRYRLFPSVLLPMPGIGKAVVKMPVTSWVRRYGAERVRAPHAERRPPARAATASTVPRRSFHDPWRRSLLLRLINERSRVRHPSGAPCAGSSAVERFPAGSENCRSGSQPSPVPGSRSLRRW